MVSRCCRMSINETCFPVEPADILPDGTPCIQGFCNKVIMFFIVDNLFAFIRCVYCFRVCARKPFKMWWNDSGTLSRKLILIGFCGFYVTTSLVNSEYIFFNTFKYYCFIFRSDCRCPNGHILDSSKLCHIVFRSQKSSP